MGRMQIHLTIYARRRLQPTTGTFVAGPSRRGNFMPDDVAEGRSSCLGVMIRHCLCNQVSSQQNWKHSCDAQIGALPVLFCDQSSTGPSCPHPRRSVHSAVARCPHRLTWQHPGRYSNQKLGSSRVGSTCTMLIIRSQSNKCLLTVLCHLWGKRDCNEVPSKLSDADPITAFNRHLR